MAQSELTGDSLPVESIHQKQLSSARDLFDEVII